MQMFLLVQEIRRRGHDCKVLKINEHRRRKSPEYVDVQNGLDYFLKLVRFALSGYRFHAHVNGESKKGYLLALTALMLSRLAGRPAALTFHGGIPQTYFPDPGSKFVRLVFRLLFQLAGAIVCNSVEIKRAIETYGIDPDRIETIPGFSREYLKSNSVSLSPEIEDFLANHQPVFFSYLSYRPEYRLEVLRQAMALFCTRHAQAGGIWLGFPAKEMPAVADYLASWQPQEAGRLLLLGNLTHDEFLTLLGRCYAYIRTPACDGVSASVLESLALGIPVVASENCRRPAGVITYREDDPADLARKLEFLCANYYQAKQQSRLDAVDDNVTRTTDWLLTELFTSGKAEVVRAC
jgi:glycosyltransferase involved in cell wall biosynthesis